MDKERNDMTEKILTLTLEIIYLLTGEDYAPVKSCTPHVTRGHIFHTSGRSQRTQSPAMDHSSSQVHEKNNEKKILELTNKIIHLLTREVPVRYDDIMVCFTMKEWEYVEGHKELYKDIITEDQDLDNSKDFHRDETEVEDDHGLPSPPCVTKDTSDLQAKACRKASTWRKPRRRRAKFISKHRDKLAAFKNNPTDDNPPENSTIKGESCTNDDGNFTSDVTCSTTNVHHPCSSNKIPPVNDESDHTGGTNTGDDVDVKPSHPEVSSCFREPPIDTVIQVPYVNTPIKEEPVPNGGPTQYPSAYDQEESWQKTNDTGANIYAVGHTQYTLAHIKTETVLREEDNLNSSIHTPPDHVQTRYTQVKVEPILEEEGYELYIPTDFTQRLPGQATKRPKDASKYGDCNKTPENAPCMNRQAKQAVDGMYVCSTCEKSFTSQFGLVKHQAMHNGNKVSCPQCGKLFFYKSSLVIHQRIHTGEKLFACPVCNKCFTNNSNLVVHQRIHTGEKPFVCSECGKRFGHKGHLNRHLRTHETEKPDANIENFVDNRLQNHWNPHKINGWTFNIYDTGPYSTYDKSV